MDDDRFADKKDAKNSLHDERSTSIHDIDFASLSGFDKGWLAIHLLAFGAIAVAVATSSLLLWQAPCGDSVRKALLELSDQCFHLPFFQMLTVVSFMLPIWLQRIGHPWSSKEYTCNAVFTLALTFAEALFLAIATHNTTNDTRGLVLVKLQTTVAS